MEIAVFINPYSGKARYGFFSEERFHDIFSKYLSSKHRFEIVKVKSPEDIPERIEYIMNFDIVAVVGGDGTVKNFMDIFVPLMMGREAKSISSPLIIPIGAGSLNVIHKNILPSQTIGTAPRILCDIVNEFDTKDDIPPNFIKKIKLLRFDEKEKQTFTHYGFMFGNGAVFKAMQIYYSRRVGPENALYLIFELLISVITGKEPGRSLRSPCEMSIKIDGWDFPHKTVYGVVASVFRKMLLFAQPFSSDMVSDGFFFAAYADQYIKLALNFPFIVLGKKVLPKSFNGVVREVDMSFDGGYTVDGELFYRDRTHLKISLGPEIKFLTKP